MSTYNKSDERERPDTEITLGLRSILGIFFGLVLICGIFFGFGYSLGRSNAVKPSVSPQDDSQTALPTPAQAPVTTVVEPAASSTSISTKPSGATLQPVASAAPPQSLVASGPAPSSVEATPAAKTTPASYTIPSTAQSALSTSTVAASQAIMVQIAAISRPQDADVLISALQKRGFNASARREASDDLLHVQIGPFSTRQLALAMRTRLLNDGYNAILK
jgi:cell division septation protein DedD